MNILNPWSLLMTLGCIASGTACSMLRGNVEPLIASLCLLFAFFAQLAANVMHKYYLVDRYLKKFPDEARYLTFLDGVPIRTALTGMGKVFFVLSAMCGLSLMTMTTSWWILIIGVLVWFFAYLAVCGKPVFTNSIPGLILAFLTFGPLAIIGTSVVQTGVGAEGAVLNMFDLAPALYMSLIAGLMGMDCNIVYYFRNNDDPLNLSGDIVKRRFSRKAVRIFLLCTGILEMLVSAGVAYSIANQGYEMIWIIVSASGGVASLLFNLYVIARLPENGSEMKKSLLIVLYAKMAIGGILALLHFAFLGLPNDNPKELF